MKTARNSRRRSGSISSRGVKAAARRGAILFAALEEFSAQGFTAARLDDVALRAGVAKGTIYLYFRDKEALFQELIRSQLAPLVQSLEEITFTGGPLRASVERFVDFFTHELYAPKRREILRLIISEGLRFPKLAEFYYREVVERVLAILRSFVERAAEGGELPNDMLLQFPELVVALGIAAVIWSGTFERFAPFKIELLTHAYLNLLFSKRPGQ